MSLRLPLFVALLWLTATGFAGEISWEKIGHYDVTRLKEILTTEAGVFNPGAPEYSLPTNNVTLYRVIYSSVIPEQDNRRITASGLVAIPDTSKREGVVATRKLPMISYQHGTVFGKEDVPSFPENSYEARLMVAQFAGHGYVVIAPDYFGLGKSDGKEGYVVVRSQQQACMDFLSAAQQLLAKENIIPTTLFLSGWSQGGFVTQAFLQRLEQERMSVTAAATVAGPSDPFAFISGFLTFPRKVDASWRSILFILLPFSYEQYFNIPGLAQSFIKPEAYDLARRIYLRKDVTSKDLPDGIAGLVREEYYDPTFFAESAFGRLLRQVTPYRWVFRTPIHMYYSENDEILRPAQARLAENYQQSLGNDKVVAISIGEKLNHRGAFAHAAPKWKAWFDKLQTHADGQPSNSPE